MTASQRHRSTRPDRKHICRIKRARLFSAAASLTAPLLCRAATDSYSAPGGGGNWSNPANWSLGHQPGNLDDAVLSSFTFVGLNVTYDAAASATNLASLTIDSPGHHPDNFFQAVNSLTTAVETVGSAGSGSLNVSGGTHTVNGALFFGNNTGSFGGGSLSGGLLSTQATYIGNDGNGTINQTAGTHLVNGTNGLYLGRDASASGTYTLAGGLLSVAFQEFVGNSGVGVFTQSGGTHTADSLYLGYNAGSSGTYNLSNGSLSAGNEIVGFVGNGSFIQTGGSHAATTLSIGDAANGTYNLSAGSLTFSTLYLGGGNPGASGTFTLANAFLGSITATEYVGAFGPGVFNHNSGTHTLGYLYVGYFSSGAYTLTDGTLTVGGESIGTSGNGIFNQIGGTHAINGSGTNGLFIASGVGSSGTYTLSGGTLSQSNGQGEFIGYSGNGVFDQNGGSHTVSNLYLGYSGASSGTYTLNAGTLNVNGLSGAEYIGYSGNGVFNQTGGTHAVATNFVLGHGGSGTCTLSAGTLMAGAESVGELGNGVFNQTGGSNAATFMYIGQGAGSAGTYNLSNAATLSLGNLFIGFSGAGAFNQSGGATTVSGPNSELSLGSTIGGTGTISLSDGTFTVAGRENIGFVGHGTFNQSGGTHTVSASGTSGLFIGFDAVNFGTFTLSGGAFTLSGGTLSVPAGTLYVGFHAAGTFTQSGGSNSAFALSIGTLANGTNPASFGTYTLADGTLTIGTTASVGASGIGVFNQSGGTHTTAALVLGANSNSGSLSPGAGTYNLSNNATLNVSSTEYVGFSGNGTLNQTGGTQTAGNLVIAANPGSGGAVNLSGGSLVVGGSTTNNGSYTQTGPSIANLGAVSGTGSILLGDDFGPPTRANVTRLDQSSIFIKFTGSLVIATNTVRFTNNVASLQINGGATFDLGNQSLKVDNAATPESRVRQYLHNGYNADATGIGNWLGTGGITSSDAIASHNGPGANFKISVGYVNGAYANDPLIGGSIPGQETLATNRILVRPALYGDLNLDGKVDDTDLAIFSGLGQYNKPTDKFGWLGGDLNQDGKVDDTDLLIFSGAGNYNGPSYGAAAAGAAPAHASATPSLTGHTQANGDIVLSSSTSAGVPGDGVLDFVYDPATGHLTLSYDGDPRVTAAQPFQVVRFKSAGGHFVPGNFNQTAFGAGVTATTSALNGTASGSNSVPDGYDMGAVLPAGLTVSDLTSDLTLQWNVFGGGLTLKNGDVVVPEPTVIGLLGLCAIGWLARRQRRPRAHPLVLTIAQVENPVTRIRR